MTPIKVLGITAARRNGKDTFARLLKKIDQRFVTFAFAHQLKADLAPFIMEQFGIDVFNVEGKEKELIRGMLISYGMARRQLNPDHWAQVVYDQIENLPSQMIGCVTDVRFESEISLFRKDFGDSFHLLEVTLPSAPEATDEEKKNIPLLQPHISSRVIWTNKEYTDTAMLPIVQKWYGQYML